MWVSEKKRQSQKRRYQEEAKEAEEVLRGMEADTSVKEGVCNSVHAQGRYVK